MFVFSNSINEFTVCEDSPVQTYYVAKGCLFFCHKMPELSKPAPGLTNMRPPALPEPPKLKPAVRRGGIKQPGQQEMPKLTRAVHWQRNDDDDAYTSLHVNKEHKDVSFVERL